jgi:hypothetical protein
VHLLEAPPTVLLCASLEQPQPRISMGDSWEDQADEIERENKPSPFSFNPNASSFSFSASATSFSPGEQSAPTANASASEVPKQDTSASKGDSTHLDIILTR